MKRFEVGDDIYGGCMYEDENGGYVSVGDVERLLQEIREEAGDCMGRTGQYIADLCKIW